MNKIEINLMELIPVRLCEFESTEEGRVVVLVPKFRHPWLAWIQSRIRQKYFRVKLDDFGTHVWLACDGRTPVSEVVRSFRERFGDVSQMYERVGKFLSRLERDGLITLNSKTGK